MGSDTGHTHPDRAAFGREVKNRRPERDIGVVRCLLALATPFLTLLGGCYLAHGLGDDDATGGPTTRVDAGPTPVDPSTSEDRGPDSRPSDYDDADDWEDPPEGARCCELDPPILVAERPMGSVDPASLAFNGTTWGVFVPASFREPAEFIELERLGSPTGHRLPLGTDTVHRMPAHWVDGRFLVSSRSLPGTLDSSRRDRSGRAEGPWLPTLELSAPTPHGHDVGWLTHEARTLAVGTDERGRAELGIVEADGELRQYRIRTRGDAAFARVVGLRSRAALAVSELNNRVTIRSAQGRGGISDAVVLARGDGEPQLHGGLAVAALRDLAIVAYEQADGTHTAVYDPFDERLVDGPHALAGEPTRGRVLLDLGADDKRNLMGLCRMIGGRNPAIVLDVLDANGRPLSPPVRIAGAGSDRPVSEGMLAGGCSVGSDSDGFLVAWNVLRQGVWVRRARLRTD